MGMLDMCGIDGIFLFFILQFFVFVDDEVDGGDVIEVDIYDGEVKIFLFGFENLMCKDDLFCFDVDFKQEVMIYVDCDVEVVCISMNDQNVVFVFGEWSFWMGVFFEVILNVMLIDGIVCFYLKSFEFDFEFYVLLIDVDLCNQVMLILMFEFFVVEFVDVIGFFYIEGMLEDMKLFIEGVFMFDEFFGQVKMVGEENWVQFFYLFDQFMEKFGGFFFYYFGNNDFILYVMYWLFDFEYLVYIEECDVLYVEFILMFYEVYDGIVGEVFEVLFDDDLIIVMLDYGFVLWCCVFYMNIWFYQNGYLVFKNFDIENDLGVLFNVDWLNSKVYVYGFSGVYVNFCGCECDGIVGFFECQVLFEEICGKLFEVVDLVYE